MFVDEKSEKYSPVTMLEELMGGRVKNKRWRDKKFRCKFILRCFINPVTTMKYFNGLCNLEHPRQIIARCPILPAKIQRPYLHKGMKVSNRAKAILEHYQFVQSFPDDYIRQILLPDRHLLLAHVEGKNSSQIDIFCGPSGYDREGELTMSFCFNGMTLARLSFTFLRYEGKQAAFIAGLQGPGRGTGTGMIRNATKACHGLFPKRMLYESFTILLEECGICDIYAVTEYNHVYRELRYFFQKKKIFLASYSEFWKSIDGVKSNAIYHLPLHVPRKSPEYIASKKRAEYRNRYNLLDILAQEIKRGMKNRPDDT
ncbi:TPA: VirK/YbjX family protein [Salmonella enterica subsp. enterica serovar Ball]